jgi:hypothetical protein
MGGCMGECESVYYKTEENCLACGGVAAAAVRAPAEVERDADLGETGPLSQGVHEGRQALRTLHMHGVELHRKRPRGSSDPSEPRICFSPLPTVASAAAKPPSACAPDREVRERAECHLNTGLGRFAALCYRSSAPHQTHECKRIGPAPHQFHKENRRLCI